MAQSLAELLPCVPKYEVRPTTPHLDKLKSIADLITGTSEPGTNWFSRINSRDLCEWSKKVASYLPKDGTFKKETTSTFSTLERLYGAMANFTAEIPTEVQALFNFFQIYEFVAGVAVTIFNDHPQTLGKINQLAERVISEIQQYIRMSALAVICCRPGYLGNFNRLLGELNQYLGEIGLDRVLDFVKSIAGIFTKLRDFAIEGLEKLTALADLIKSIVRAVLERYSHHLPAGVVPRLHRSKKWKTLDLTDEILTKNIQLDRDGQHVKQTLSKVNGVYSAIDHEEQQAPDKPLPDDMKLMGDSLQRVEEVLSVGLLALKGQHSSVDIIDKDIEESQRVLDKYSSLHPLYKTFCGPTFLSKLRESLRSIVNQILFIAKNPEEFIRLIKEKYIDLLKILLGNFFNNDEAVKKVTDAIPGELDDIIIHAGRDIFRRWVK